ncbi:MAG: hypothetical protein QWI36_02255 [Wolbachia endosymbiont of Tyrophagus putrescentiae]|nr:hypothetical protein [Wolbachia endosymbiont of Tyrophagus putrescentiae]
MESFNNICNSTTNSTTDTDDNQRILTKYALIGGMVAVGAAAAVYRPCRKEKISSKLSEVSSTQGNNEFHEVN